MRRFSQSSIHDVPAREDTSAGYKPPMTIYRRNSLLSRTKGEAVSPEAASSIMDAGQRLPSIETGLGIPALERNVNRRLAPQDDDCKLITLCHGT